MKRLVFLLSLFISTSIFGQVYQLMPQYGYQAPRMAFDSTLQIPTVCGVPTLKSVQFVTKKSALAYDSCNGRFYTYNPKTQVWSQVTGGSSTDTTSLSNRINQKIDSIKRSADSVIIYKNGVGTFAYRDSVGSGSDTASVVKATVHNAEATTLTKGTVVYLYGANGNIASVKRAYNTSDTFSSKTFAIVKNDIPAGNNGIVITQGVVDKLNLGSYTAGDIVWLDSLPGQFTKNKPVAPLHQVFIGVVERANNGNGQLFVKIQNGYELGELHNVSVNGEANNDVLYYQSSTKLWKAKSPYSLIDTTQLSSRIDNRVKISDTANMLTNYAKTSAVNLKVNISDTANMLTNYAKTSAVNLKVNISDTSVFQRKSIASYSLMANNTNASANVTTQAFRDTSFTLSGSDISWVGTTAPSGTKDETIRWVQVGKMVTVYITLYYSTAGSGNSGVNVAFPSSLPTPFYPSAMGSASRMISSGIGAFSTNYQQPSTFYRGGLRRNSGNTGNEFFASFTSGSGGANWAQIIVTYFTN